MKSSRKVCITLLAIGLNFGCKSNRNSEILETPGAENSISDDIDLDDPIDQNNTNLLLTDIEPITAEPDNNYKEDMINNPQASALNPLKFGELRSHKPRKFAGATVLAALRRLRRHFNTNPFFANPSFAFGSDGGPLVTIPHSLGIAKVKYDALMDENANEINLSRPIDGYQYAWNFDGVGSQGGNLTIMPSFWSDLQAHFYVIPAHRRHGCWTMMLYQREDILKTVHGVDEGNFRKFIRDICSGERVFSKSEMTEAPLSAFAIGILPTQLSAYNLLWVDPRRNGFIKLPDEIKDSGDQAILGDADPSEITHPEKVSELKAVKWSKTQRKRGYVNVWDYIMLSQLYAFDFEQQQAVLNAYYGDHKKYSAVAGEFNPNDTTECGSWRKSTENDPSDGTQCSPTKTVQMPALANGY